MSSIPNNTPMPAIATSRNYRTARIPVDSQQKSFDELGQFRFFVTISDLYASDFPPIAANQQLVFKISSTKAFNVIVREPLFYEGGRMYRVFPDDGNAAFTGTLTNRNSWITNVNTNKETSGATDFPTSGLNIESAVGAGIFTSTSHAPNGTCVATGGAGNKSTSEYGPNDIKSGVATGLTFWLVFDHIGINEATKGMFTLAVELA